MPLEDAGFVGSLILAYHFYRLSTQRAGYRMERYSIPDWEKIPNHGKKSQALITITGLTFLLCQHVKNRLSG
jgi:hypothetical protein